jgi:hypothetical protein
MLRRVIIGSILTLLILVLITRNRSDIAGTYVYVNDGQCYFLPFDEDTLILHKNGEVESKNFPDDAVYRHEKKFLENEVIISSETKKESSQLLVRTNFLFGKRLVVCLDQKGYYQKQ